MTPLKKEKKGPVENNGKFESTIGWKQFEICLYIPSISEIIICLLLFLIFNSGKFSSESSNINPVL